MVEEIGVILENYRPVASHWQTLSHNVAIEYTSPWAGFNLTTLVVIGEKSGTCNSEICLNKFERLPYAVVFLSDFIYIGFSFAVSEEKLFNTYSDRVIW